MTHKNDIIRLEDPGDGSHVNLLCKNNGIEWPPPVEIKIHGCTWVKISESQLTDEQVSKMDYVGRGALYHPKNHPPKEKKKPSIREASAEDYYNK